MRNTPLSFASYITRARRMSKGTAAIVMCLLCTSCGIWGSRIDYDRLRLGMTRQEVERAFGPPFRKHDEGAGQAIWIYRMVKITFFDSTRADDVLWFHGKRLTRVCENRWTPVRFFHRTVGIRWDGYERRWRAGKWVAKRMSKSESAGLLKKIDSIEPHAPLWSSNTPAKREDRIFW